MKKQTLKVGSKVTAKLGNDFGSKVVRNAGCEGVTGTVTEIESNGIIRVDFPRVCRFTGKPKSSINFAFESSELIVVK